MEIRCHVTHSLIHSLPSFPSYQEPPSSPLPSLLWSQLAQASLMPSCPQLITFHVVVVVWYYIYIHIYKALENEKVLVIVHCEAIYGKLEEEEGTVGNCWVMKEGLWCAWHLKGVEGEGGVSWGHAEFLHSHLMVHCNVDDPLPHICLFIPTIHWGFWVWNGFFIHSPVNSSIYNG